MFEEALDYQRPVDYDRMCPVCLSNNKVSPLLKRDEIVSRDGRPTWIRHYICSQCTHEETIKEVA